jgi:hypothetical protein
MNYFTRLGMCAVVAVVLFAGVSSLASSWFDDPLSFLRLCRVLLHESHRSRALEERAHLLDHCLHLRMYAVDEIFAGRLTLREGAMRFHEATDLVDNDAPHLLASYQKPATEEGTFRQVLAWVRLKALAVSSAEGARVVERTRAEFFELLPSAAPLDHPSSIIDP